MVLRHLRETAALATMHFSTFIEGNRLTCPKCAPPLKATAFPGVSATKQKSAIIFACLRPWRRYPSGWAELPRLIHGLVMTGRNERSPYRVVQNVIREAVSRSIVYLPPEPPDVAQLMLDLVVWINSALEAGDTPAPVVAGIAHYQFATIHPYLDGNGRTARLLATRILRKSGYGLKGIYSLDEHYAGNLPAYYAALTVGTHNYYDGRADGDITGFIEYFFAGMADAFSRGVRKAATRADKEAAADESATMRDLDPRHAGCSRYSIDRVRRPQAKWPSILE